MNFKEQLIKLIENTDDWETLKKKLETSYNTSLQKDVKKNTLAGKLFEYFAKYFFICNPLYQSEYKNVWLFDEIPLDVKKEKEDLWNEKFELLKQWLKNHDNNFPNNPLSKNTLEKTVSVFVNYNRNWYNGTLGKCKYGKFPDERKQMLDSIGFEWNQIANDKKWDTKLKTAIEQIKLYGNIKYNINGETNPIFSWLTNQRLAFRNHKLSEERIAKLKEIGIELET
ncbi:MAG: helicase associated domain-containing protein [Treponema sp.]|nr:helicase associated domain-containing protein [Treponema sp.]